MIILWILIILISIIIIGFIISRNKANEQRKIPKAFLTDSHSPPKIILLVLDSLMDEPLKKAIQENKAPALASF